MEFQRDDPYAPWEPQRQLWWRCVHANAPLIKQALHEWKYNPGHFCDSENKTSALHKLVQHGGQMQLQEVLEFIDGLLDIGIDVNGQDSDGATAAHYATHFEQMSDRVAVVAKLLEHNADVLTTTGDGRSALSVLLHNCNCSDAQMLLNIIDPQTVARFYHSEQIQLVGDLANDIEIHMTQHQQQRIAQQVGSGQHRTRKKL